MAAITGKEALIGLDFGSTHATETACTKLFAVDSFNQSNNTEVLQTSSIGLDKSMQNNMDQGAINPTISFSGKVGYENNYHYLLAALMGTAAAPAEQTGAEGDYMSRLTLADDLNPQWLSMAALITSSETLAWPSVALDSLVLTYAPNTYLQADFTGIADTRVLGSATNTQAVLAGLSAPAEDEIVITQADEFLINAQAGGALASPTDRVEIKSAVFSLNKPQASTATIKGSAGNSETRSTDLYTATLTIVYDTLADDSIFDAAAAGTEYKATLNIQGDQIGAGDNYTLALFMPRLKIIQDPEHNLTSLGHNEASITYECLEATANPTGMDSVRPYFEITNLESTLYTT